MGLKAERFRGAKQRQVERRGAISWAQWNWHATWTRRSTGPPGPDFYNGTAPQGEAHKVRAVAVPLAGAMDYTAAHFDHMPGHTREAWQAYFDFVYEKSPVFVEHLDEHHSWYGPRFREYFGYHVAPWHVRVWTSRVWWKHLHKPEGVPSADPPRRSSDRPHDYVVINVHRSE